MFHAEFITFADEKTRSMIPRDFWAKNRLDDGQINSEIAMDYSLTIHWLFIDYSLAIRKTSKKDRYKVFFLENFFVSSAAFKVLSEPLKDGMFHAHEISPTTTPSLSQELFYCTFKLLKSYGKSKIYS